MKYLQPGDGFYVLFTPVPKEKTIETGLLHITQQRTQKKGPKVFPLTI